MYHSTSISHFPAPPFIYPGPHRTRTFVAKSGATTYPPSQYFDPLSVPSNRASIGVLRPPSPSPDCCSSFCLYPRPTYASQASNRNEKTKTELHSIRPIQHSIRPIQDTKHELQLNHTKVTKKLQRRNSVQRPVAGPRFSTLSQAHSHLRQSSNIPLLSTSPLESTDVDNHIDQSEYEYEYDHKRHRDHAQRACRRKKIDKLSRTFGESAPQDLIFPELAPINLDMDIHRHTDQKTPSSCISSFVMTPDANGGNTFESQSQSDATHVLSSSLEHPSSSPISAIETSVPGAHKTRNRTSVPPNLSFDECSFTIDFDAISCARTINSKIDSTIPPLPSTPPPKELLMRHRRRSQGSTLAPRHEDRRVSSCLSIAEETKLSKHHEVEIVKKNDGETVAEISEISRQQDRKDLRTSTELQMPVGAAPQINLSSSEVRHNSNVKHRSSVSRTTKMQRRKASVRPGNSCSPPILVDGNGETYVRFDYFTAALMPAASPDSMSCATREANHESGDLSLSPYSILEMEALTRNEGKEARDTTVATNSMRAPSRVSSLSPLSMKGIDSQVEHGRRKELEWSGEWNLGDMGEVMKGLRELKTQ